MTTQDMTTKEMLIRAMAKLPEDASFMDVIECVLLVYEIQQGMEQVEAEQTVTQEEALKRIRKWRE